MGTLKFTPWREKSVNFFDMFGDPYNVDENEFLAQQETDIQIKN